MSVRTKRVLAIFGILTSCALIWFSVAIVERGVVQYPVVRRVDELGGFVMYAAHEPGARNRVRRWIAAVVGDCCGSDVLSVDLHGKPATDDDVRQILQLGLNQAYPPCATRA
jgi:hypothetical protein